VKHTPGNLLLANDIQNFLDSILEDFATSKNGYSVDEEPSESGASTPTALSVLPNRVEPASTLPKLSSTNLTRTMVQDTSVDVVVVRNSGVRNGCLTGAHCLLA
jgi:hypothetical protein